MSKYICRSERYTPTPDEFKSVAEFTNMCRVFGPAPYLTERDGDWYEGDELVLEAVPAPSKYIVQTATAKMPSTSWGRYRRVAVLEVDPEVPGQVAMISERAKGVRSIVRTWEKLHEGKTERCAFEVALKEAHEVADFLNEASELVQAQS